MKIIPRTSKRKEHLASGKLRKRLKMAIEIVDLPIENGDFPYVAVYQRVSGEFLGQCKKFRHLAFTALQKHVGKRTFLGG